MLTLPTTMIQMVVVVCEPLGKAKALSENSQSLRLENRCFNQGHDLFSSFNLSHLTLAPA
jgi:hypothetical protein